MVEKTKLTGIALIGVLALIAGLFLAEAWLIMLLVGVMASCVSI